MYVFYISGEEVKNFMNKILRENYFDDFQVRTVEIHSFVRLAIDGKFDENFIKEEKGESFDENLFFSDWGRVRRYVFDFVKGKVKPSYMKFVFSAPDELLCKISENAAALFLNFTFEKDRVVCTTGTSQKKFELNRELDLAWEEYVRAFFKNIQITVVDENY